MNRVTVLNLDTTNFMSMKTLSLIVLSLFLMSAGWPVDFEKAQQQAQVEHKPILLYFSGMDWCYTCKQTQKNILDKPAFKKYAATSLVLVMADFPRISKRTVSKKQAIKNEALATRYNPDKVIPRFLLLDADGKLLREWVGNPGVTAEVFVSQMQAAQK